MKLKQPTLGSLTACSQHLHELWVGAFKSGADVRGRHSVQFASEVPGVVERTLAGRPAPEDLLVGVPEVLGQKGVDDGVDGGVAVGQTVSHHPKDERGLVQRERAELHPQVYHVVRQPGQTEDHHYHQDGQRGLKRGRSCDHLTHRPGVSKHYRFQLDLNSF